MNGGIKKALEPSPNKTAPTPSPRSSIGEVITDKGHPLDRWVVHFSDLYSRENIVSPVALDAVEFLEELDTEPTLEELSKTIDSLASGKGKRRLPPPPPPT